jgi:hypothetical protein
MLVLIGLALIVGTLLVELGLLWLTWWLFRPRPRVTWRIVAAVVSFALFLGLLPVGFYTVLFGVMFVTGTGFGP